MPQPCQRQIALLTCQASALSGWGGLGAESPLRNAHYGMYPKSLAGMLGTPTRGASKVNAVTGSSSPEGRSPWMLMSDCTCKPESRPPLLMESTHKGKLHIDKRAFNTVRTMCTG